jgi:uncharacterized protein (DUF2235 family)
MLAKNASSSRKRIAIFLDGTWNDTKSNTNVWRLAALCAGQGSDGAPQVAYYSVGVNGIAGGMLGKGVAANIVDAYEWLVGQYNPDDEIFIFGFSRGAFTARSLAGFIAKYGLLKPGSPLGVAQLFERYRRSGDKTIWELVADEESGALGSPSIEERWMLRYSMPVPVKMVGVWDTVGALGVPWFSFEGISRSSFGWLHTGLRVPIQHAFHVLAVDEHRLSFSPTPWTVLRTTKAQPRSLGSVEQRWFPGNHGNVGGGYSGDLLVQAPLKWLKGKAEQLGLAFRYGVEVDPDVHKAPIADSYSDFMKGIYKHFSKRHFRQIAPPPFEGEKGTYTRVNETIDASVFDRWRSNSNYRPANVTDWAKRYGIDPNELTASVLASAPTNVVAE